MAVRGCNILHLNALEFYVWFDVHGMKVFSLESGTIEEDDKYLLE